MYSLSLVVDLHAAVNNVKQLSAAKEKLEFALLYSYKISYTVVRITKVLKF
jgi:hypothetical protein